MQKITPFLWFDNNAEDAIEFYAGIFDDVKVWNKTYMGAGGPLLTASFSLNGQEFIALNGGPVFHFTEAISFMIACPTQEEIDDKWEKLSADGGQKSRCGWLKDKFGLSWQVVPPALNDMLRDPDQEKAKRVMDAMMKMDKIDIEALRNA